MNFGEGIYDIIFKIYLEQSTIAQGYANKIEPMIRFGAGIGALLYIFGKLLIEISNNQTPQIISYFRPFIILLLIPMSSKICNAIDNFGNEVRTVVSGENNNVAKTIQDNSEQIKKLVDKKWEEIGNNSEKYKAVFNSDLAEDKSGFMGETWIDFKIGLYRISEDFKFQMLSVIQSILLTIMYIAECTLLLISIGFRIVLRIGFPITVALSIFPAFTQSLATWFGRYINFALLPAVASMYSSLAFSLCNQYVKNYNVQESMSTMGVETQQPEFLGLAFIAILILSLIGYTQVPSMTSMLISVGGVGQLIQGATRTVQSIPNKTSQATKPFRVVSQSFNTSTGTGSYSVNQSNNKT